MKKEEQKQEELLLLLNCVDPIGGFIYYTTVVSLMVAFLLFFHSFFFYYHNISNHLYIHQHIYMFTFFNSQGVSNYRDIYFNMFTVKICQDFLFLFGSYHHPSQCLVYIYDIYVNKRYQRYCYMLTMKPKSEHIIGFYVYAT